jgi:hypothetical protein
MLKIWYTALRAVVLSATAVLLTACSIINDDLSDCPTSEQKATLDYELRLVTNMTTEVKTQLSAQTDLELAATLTNYLSDIFTDYAHDVDLSFYDTQGSYSRLHHDEHIMNGSEHSYTLYIPRRKYMHLAVANLANDPVVYLDNDESCYDAVLRQVDGDTINSHSTGIFTARQYMEMIEGVDQTFNVKLYMANCSALLVVDPRGHNISGMKVFTTGFATAFHIADSVYEYKKPSPLIRTTRLAPDESGCVGFCSVNFPSREPSSSAAPKTTRTVIETTEPFIAQPGQEALWEFHVFVPQPDGSVTKSVLGIMEPLRAGQLKIVRCKLGDDGGIVTSDQSVAVSVTLNWNNGGNYDPVL